VLGVMYGEDNDSCGSELNYQCQLVWDYS